MVGSFFQKWFGGSGSGNSRKDTAWAAPTLTSSDSSSNNGTFDDGLKEPIASSREDEGFDKYYAPIDSYEGKHRYDPTAKWTDSEERHVIRKVLNPSY